MSRSSIDLAAHWLPADWPAPACIRAGITLRAAGDFGRQASEAASTRQALADALGLPQIHWLQQVHGTQVVAQHCTANAPELQADAVWTSREALACAVLTADCLPVLFCSRDGQRIAAAHAGWRGLLAGVLEATVAALQAEHAQDLLVWLGPAIGPAAFQVGPEVRAAFMAVDPEAASAFVPDTGDRWRANLGALARQRLQSVGVQSEAIYGGQHCTWTESTRFHSWRRDGADSGRMASVIVRTGH